MSTIRQPDPSGQPPDDPPACPACGHERPRFKGRRNRSEVYECSAVGCNLLFEVLQPALEPPSRRGGRA